jgi:hypothetical protein
MIRNYKRINQKYGEFMNLDIKYIPRLNLLRNEETKNLELELDLMEQNNDTEDSETHRNYPDNGENEYHEDEETEIINPESDEKETIEVNTSKTESDDESIEVGQGRIRGVDRALKNLETFFNPDPWSHTR